MTPAARRWVCSIPFALWFALPIAAFAEAQAGMPAAGDLDGAATVAIEGADQVAAREKALAQALRAAVANAVVATIGVEETAARGAELEREVLARSRAFVAGYRVVEEGAQGGEYHVAVRARVATAALEHALSRRESGAEPGPPDAPETPGAAESSADVLLTGSLTAERYKAVRGALEQQMPGVRTVAVLALEPGAITLRVRGTFPARALASYLATGAFTGFRLVVTPAAVGSDVEVVVQDVEVTP